MSQETNKGASPYEGLPRRQFWRAGVAESNMLSPTDLYSKKFEISMSDRVATAGSCFAQHISRQMRARGYSVLDAEPAPPSLPTEYWTEFGYGMYSGRYANIYTVRQLRQLVEEAIGLAVSPDPVWVKDGRYYDSARPSVEPNGLDSAEEVRLHRDFHLQKVKQLLLDCDVFVFTLGLTETWMHSGSGWAFPTAPGTIAGNWDSDKYHFHNFTTAEIVDDLRVVIDLIDRLRKGRALRYILTVSPVPLTASFEDQHVLVSTTYSKSVLRAAAGEIASSYQNIDYFPSYEIISNTWNRGVFYEPNCRSVTPTGVGTVMGVFFSQHNLESSNEAQDLQVRLDSGPQELEEANCEESLLDQFSEK